jgi:hypothetical protein
MFSLSVHAVDLASLSNKDVVAGLKEALSQSSNAAIAKLGVENGSSETSARNPAARQVAER